MANSLLTPDSDQDEALNKGQQYYDEKFAGIVNAENEAEENTDAFDDQPADWNNSYDKPAPSVSDKTRRLISKASVKKASPILGTGGIVALLGFLFLGMTAPSLLFVQMKETMVDRFNTQLSAFESRSTKLLHSKMNGGTKGHCGSVVTLRCKFTSLPDKHVKKLKDAGITFKDEGKTIGGRTTFSAYVIDGKEVTAQNFNKEVGSNAKLRSAIRKAYNPKYASFTGKGWASISSRYKIKKQAPTLDTESDPTKAQEKLNKIGKEGVASTDTKVRAACTGDNCSDTSWTEENEGDTKKNVQDLDESGKSGEAAREVRKNLSRIGTGAVGGSALKLTGAVDNACLLYGAVNTLSFAVKTIRNAQLIRFAMIFLSTADAIKAGESPNPKDIEFLGNNLTATIKDPQDSKKTLVGSATDSFGYKYAAYGDASAPKASLDISNRFMSGGGFTGEMGNNINTVLSYVGGRGTMKGTCDTLANPFVQAGSLIAGVAMLFVPGVNVAKVAVSVAVGAAVVAVVTIVPSLIADTLAGTVTENIVGEESGNAIASGSGAMMSALAASNGVGYMTNDQAIAYNEDLINTKNDYIAMERSEKSPFDITSPHTFLGSIAAKFIPIAHSSTSNPATMVSSVLSLSLKGILPKASAVSNEQFKDALNACGDMDLNDAGIATDPFCNTINGIPSKYLGKDPIAVIDELGGQIDESGKPLGAYKDFVEKCIDSSNPVGYHDGGSGMSFDLDRAKGCIINDSNANYYLNYLDNRIEEGMEAEEKKSSKPTAGDWVHPLGGYVMWGTYVGDSHAKGAIDFAAAGGSPVYAVSGGTVIETSTSGGYGNSVTIKHGDDTFTHYAHFMEKAMVSVGDTVTAGQQIGKVGTTGNSTGNHLHLEGRSSAEWGGIVPTYRYLKDRGVDIGDCTINGDYSGPCSMSGF